MNVTYEYPDGRLLIYENYPFTAYGLHGFDNGNVFYGTEGYMIFSRRGAFSVFLGPKGNAGPDRRQGTARPDRLRRAHGRLSQCRPQAHADESECRDGAPQLCAGAPGRDRLSHARPARLRRHAAEVRRLPEADALLTKTYRAPYALPAIR